MLHRKATSQEERLLEFLIKKASLKISENWKNNLLVQPMDDGGMGSLLLFPYGQIIENRLFGKQVSEVQFSDADGFIVSAALNVDKEGKLFELDIWKTNFGKLITLPEIYE